MRMPDATPDTARAPHVLWCRAGRRGSENISSKIFLCFEYINYLWMIFENRKQTYVKL